MNRADHVIAAVAGALALAVIAVLMWQDGRDNYRVMLSAQACVALDPISAPLMPAPGGGCALKGNSGPDGLTGGYYLRVYRLGAFTEVERSG